MSVAAICYITTLPDETGLRTTRTRDLFGFVAKGSITPVGPARPADTDRFGRSRLLPIEGPQSFAEAKKIPYVRRRQLISQNWITPPPRRRYMAGLIAGLDAKTIRARKRLPPTPIQDLLVCPDGRHPRSPRPSRQAPGGVSKKKTYHVPKLLRLDPSYKIPFVRGGRKPTFILCVNGIGA